MMYYVVKYFKDSIADLAHNDSVEQFMDTATGTLFAYFSFIKLTTGDVSVHSCFEAFFFYIGGSLTIAWGVFRLLSAHQTYLIQQQAIDFANGKDPKKSNIAYYIIAFVLIAIFIYFYAT